MFSPRSEVIYEKCSSEKLSQEVSLKEFEKEEKSAPEFKKEENFIPISSCVCDVRTYLGTLVSLKFLFGFVNQSSFSFSVVCTLFCRSGNHATMLNQNFTHNEFTVILILRLANPNMIGFGYKITRSKILLLFFDGSSVIFSHICTPEMDLSITGLFISKKCKHTLNTPHTLAKIQEALNITMYIELSKN